MKKRFLPFGLNTAFAGFFFLFFSMLMMAGQPGNPDLRKHDGSRYESARANQVTGTVNPLDVLHARQQAEMLRTKSSTSTNGLHWISAGPTNYPGLVWSTIYDNTDKTGQTLIAGAAGGGLWKSTNLGLTWAQMAVENQLIPKVSSIVQATNGTIYAATGVSTCHNLKFIGNGIYSSLNGSQFTAIPATKTNPDFQGVTKLAIAPSGRLYAATIGGLYSSDDAATWNKIKTGYSTDVCVGSDGTVLAAVGDSAYMSLQGTLDNWVTLTTGLSTTLPKSGIGWMVFAISPSDSKVMYASLAKTDGRLFDIFCSTDKGTTWSVIFPNNPSFEPFGIYGCYSNTIAVSPTDPNQVYLGGVNMWHGRRVQPTGYFNWETVSYGFYSPWFPNSAPAYHHSYMFCPGNPHQMVVSTDGGVSIGTVTDTITFKTINKEMVTSQFNAVSFSAQRPYVMGGGDRVGTIALGYFYPSTVNEPNDGFPIWYPTGLLQAGNGGPCEWSNIDSRVAVYTQYKGAPAVRRQDFTDLSYDNDFMNGVDTVHSAFVPMRLWESFNYANTHDSVVYKARLKAVRADTTILIESASSKFKFPYHTVAKIDSGASITVADPIASRFFFYGNKSNVKGIYMTKDMLKFDKHPNYFVTYIQPATPDTDYITALSVSADLNVAWAGTKKGRLVRISGLLQANDSATANITSSKCKLVDSTFSFPGIRNRMVTSISINPVDNFKVLVTLGNYGNQDYVYYTSNGNAPRPTFTSVQNDLPKSPVYSGLIEMSGTSAFLGTDLGVFSTTNITANPPQWLPDMENLGDVAVTDIRQQVIKDFHILNYGVIYLASYGRGLWYDTTNYKPVGIPAVTGHPAVYGVLNLNPNPVHDILHISYTNEESSTLVANVYDLNGRLVMSSNLGFQSKGIVNGQLNVAGLSTGSYIVRIGTSFAKMIKL